MIIFLLMVSFSLNKAHPFSFLENPPVEYDENYFVGNWRAENMQCNDRTPKTELIQMHNENGQAIAIKTLGDDCVTTGNETFRLDIPKNGKWVTGHNYSAHYITGNAGSPNSGKMTRDMRIVDKDKFTSGPVTYTRDPTPVAPAPIAPAPVAPAPIAVPLPIAPAPVAPAPIAVPLPIAPAPVTVPLPIAPAPVIPVHKPNPGVEILPAPHPVISVRPQPIAIVDPVPIAQPNKVAPAQKPKAQPKKVAHKSPKKPETIVLPVYVLRYFDNCQDKAKYEDFDVLQALLDYDRDHNRRRRNKKHLAKSGCRRRD